MIFQIDESTPYPTFPDHAQAMRTDSLLWAAI